MLRKRPWTVPEPWRSAIVVGMILWLFGSFAMALYLQYSPWQALLIAYIPAGLVYLLGPVIARALSGEDQRKCKTILKGAESHSVDARNPRERDC